jgi:hypothetical protein
LGLFIPVQQADRRPSLEPDVAYPHGIVLKRRFGDRAGGLGQHGEAFAVEVRLGRQGLGNVEEHDLLDLHRCLGLVDQPGAAERADPLADDLDALGRFAAVGQHDGGRSLSHAVERER